MSWVEFGAVKKRKFCLVHRIFSDPGESKALVLPFFLSFTGCGQVSLIFHVTRSYTWEAWRSFEKFTSYFSNLSHQPTLAPVERAKPVICYRPMNQLITLRPQMQLRWNMFYTRLLLLVMYLHWGFLGCWDSIRQQIPAPQRYFHFGTNIFCYMVYQHLKNFRWGMIFLWCDVILFVTMWYFLSKENIKRFSPKRGVFYILSILY